MDGLSRNVDLIAKITRRGQGISTEKNPTRAVDQKPLALSVQARGNNRCHIAALRAHTGHKKRNRRSNRPYSFHLLRAGGSDNQHAVARYIPFGAYAHGNRLPQRPAARLESLKLASPWVRGPTQEIGR